MDLQLAGQTAVVVGAARGIGQAIAAAFAGEKANTALLDCEASVSAAAEELGRSHGVRSLGLVADVTDQNSTQRAAGEIQSYFGRIDHVIFAVAIGSGKFGFPF